jgi:hypothetical protein
VVAAGVFLLSCRMSRVAEPSKSPCLLPRWGSRLMRTRGMGQTHRLAHDQAKLLASLRGVERRQTRGPTGPRAQPCGCLPSYGLRPAVSPPFLLCMALTIAASCLTLGGRRRISRQRLFRCRRPLGYEPRGYRGRPSALHAREDTRAGSGVRSGGGCWRRRAVETAGGGEGKCCPPSAAPDFFL